MIGVGQLHLTTDFLQVKGRHSTLDGALRANIHKNRGLNRAMGALKNAAAGSSLLSNYFKHGQFSLLRS
jgi:hypothetical protein